MVRHTAGLTTFMRVVHGIRQGLKVFVDVDEPVKFSLLTLTNDSPVARSLSIFAYDDVGAWSAARRRTPPCRHGGRRGERGDSGDQRLQPGLRVARRVLLRQRGACVVHSGTADRSGRNGDVEPAALAQSVLSGQLGASLIPARGFRSRASWRLVRPGSSCFSWGKGIDYVHVRQLIARHGNVDAALRALARVQASWDETLETVQVHTPDDSFDALMNRWLLYQAISCRLWTRGGYFQPGGAFGFRDQLQDVMALLFARPDLARDTCSARRDASSSKAMCSIGGTNRAAAGVRTRCSDDLLWLPYVVAEYVRTTGDTAVLDERVPFLKAMPLGTGEHESYGLPSVAAQSGTLFDHCVRAIDRGTTTGPMASLSWARAIGMTG